MGAKVFIDTSAWLAYILKSEKKHEQVKSSITAFVKDGTILSTSNDVIDETVTRLVYATNPSITSRYITFIEKSMAMKNLIQLWVDEQVQKEGLVIVKKFADQKISLTDATSMVLYRRYNMKAIVTLDSDFAKLGYNSVP